MKVFKVFIVLLIMLIVILVVYFSKPKSKPKPEPSPVYPKIPNQSAQSSLVPDPGTGKIFSSFLDDNKILKAYTASKPKSFAGTPFLGVYLDKKKNKYQVIRVIVCKSDEGNNSMLFYKIPGLKEDEINSNTDQIDLYYLEKSSYTAISKSGQNGPQMFWSFSSICFAYGANEEPTSKRKSGDIVIICYNAEENIVLPIYTNLLNISNEPEGLRLIFGYNYCDEWLNYNQYNLAKGVIYYY